MSSSHLIRLQRVKGENGILAALMHNKRTLQVEGNSMAHIDSAKSPLNYALIGDSTPESISRYAKSQMILAGIEKCRKDQVRAVEILFSLPINRHQQDTRPFFSDCYEWVKQNFAGDLLSFDVHLDESAPHAHALILPLIDGKMQGSDMIGGIGNLNRLINLFHENVAKHYGLSRSEKSRLSETDKLSLAKLVLSRLKNDPVMKSCVWNCIRDAIHKDPLPYAQMLSIQLPTKTVKVKSFIDHKRSKGKGSFIR